MTGALRVATRWGISLVGATGLVYGLVQLAPGDASACGDAAEPIRFGAWWVRVLQLDLGRPCFGPAGTVGALVGPALARTLGLVAAATALGGSVAALAVWTGGRLGALGRGLLLVGSVPAFALAYGVATGLDAAAAPCLIRGGCPAWFPLQAHDSGLAFVVAAGVLGLGSGQIRAWLRRLEVEVRRALDADWVLFEVAGGEPRARVLARALAAPVGALAVDRAAAALAEAVVVEAVLGTRGLGTLTWEAARFRDLPVLLAAAAAWALSLAVLREVASGVGRSR